MDMKRHMLNYFFISTSVACAVSPSVYPLQNRKTQHVNIVLQCKYGLNGKPIFWNLFEFSAAEIT